MGTTRTINGENRIVFHVGKELPSNGENFILVPGNQSAQGRGVYASEKPLLQYAGGEHYKKEMERSPIFVLPANGRWTKGKNTMKNSKGEKVRSKKDNDDPLITWHSEGKAIVFKDCILVPSQDLHENSVYVFAKEYGFFDEPAEQVFDSYYDKVRRGEIDPLNNEKLEIKWLDSHDIFKEMETSIQEGRLLPEIGDVWKRHIEGSECVHETKEEISFVKGRR